MSSLKGRKKKSDKSKYSGLVQKLREYSREEVLKILQRYSKKEMLAILEEYNKSCEELQRLERNAKQRIRQVSTRLLYNYQNTYKIKLLGCSPFEFWKMRGSPSAEELKDLHIDHIFPFSWFDLSDEDHVKVCCHYTNLQYLSSSDNLKKHNSYAGSPNSIIVYKHEFDVDAHISERLVIINALN